jgi:hypothetical protein
VFAVSCWAPKVSAIIESNNNNLALVIHFSLWVVELSFFEISKSRAFVRSPGLPKGA